MQADDKKSALATMVRRLYARVPDESMAEDEYVRMFMRHIRTSATALSLLMDANEDEGRNFITIGYEAEGIPSCELTFRRCGGVTPAERIDALEREVMRLRQLVGSPAGDPRQEFDPWPDCRDEWEA